MMESRGIGMRMRPMGIGDVLDETFRLYRRHFLSFVTAMAVVTVPMTLLSTALSLLLGLGSLQDQFQPGRFRMEDLVTVIAAAVAGGLVVGIISAVGYLLSGGAVVRMASDAALGQGLDVGTAYRAALGRLRSLFWASLLTSLAVGLLVVTCIGIPVGMYFGLGWSLFVSVQPRQGGWLGAGRFCKLAA